ncbi:ABC transporter F family member 2-like [Juglans regia]|uniref:ABC transporter F family member 2-like n=1 Tax=Juglans regia TaxID=51240 RepID=A0A2I4F8A6_JUGRE|nr:ABC transporter F family member 2-like [Juglans regia]
MSDCSGWQMRMSLGKILLQGPNMLLDDTVSGEVAQEFAECCQGMYVFRGQIASGVLERDLIVMNLCTMLRKLLA